MIMEVPNIMKSLEKLVAEQLAWNKDADRKGKANRINFSFLIILLRISPNQFYPTQSPCIHSDDIKNMENLKSMPMTVIKS